jgi:hypothetical protein
VLLSFRVGNHKSIRDEHVLAALSFAVHAVRESFSNWSNRVPRYQKGWLYSYPRQRKRVVFERNLDEVKVGRESRYRALAELLGRQFGEDILGRDEVWFVEKDQDGATTLYALADFRPRKPFPHFLSPSSTT